MTIPERAASRGVADDRGSLLVAMLVILLLSALALTAVATALRGQVDTRRDENFEQALAAAEYGSDALVAQIRQDLWRDPASLITGSGLPVSGTNGTYDAQVVKDTAPNGTPVWTVTTTGRVGESSRTVQVEVGAGPGLDLAFYARSGFTMSGSGSSDSYDSRAGTPCVEKQGNTIEICPASATGRGRVATEGSMTLHGNTADGVDGVDIYYATQGTLDAYNPGEVQSDANATGRCDQCPPAGGISPDGLPKVRAFPDRIQLDQPAVCLNRSFNPWTMGTRLVAGVNAYSGSEELPIRIDDDTLPLTLTDDQSVILCARGTIEIDGHDNGVNMFAPVDNQSPPTPRKASRLFIFLDRLDGGAPSLNFKNHCAISALIYAPNASFAGAKSNAQCDIYGSMLVNSITTQGGVGLHYDEALADATVNVPVHVGQWREIR